MNGRFLGSLGGQAGVAAGDGYPSSACIRQPAGRRKLLGGVQGGPPELPESSAVHPRRSALLSRLQLSPGLVGTWPAAFSQGRSGHPLMTRTGRASPPWEARKQERKRVTRERTGGPLPAMFPGKSLPLSLNFPEVWPSGLGHLLAGAASAIRRGPGQRAAIPLPHSVHTHHTGCWPAGPTAGSCRAACPSMGHRNLEPAATPHT